MFLKNCYSLLFLIGLVKLSAAQYGSMRGNDYSYGYQQQQPISYQQQDHYNYQQPYQVSSSEYVTQPYHVSGYGAQQQVDQQHVSLTEPQQPVQVQQPSYSHLQVQVKPEKQEAPQLQPVSQSLLRELIRQIPKLEILTPDLTSNIVKTTLPDGKQAFVLLPSNISFPIKQTKSIGRSANKSDIQESPIPTTTVLTTVVTSEQTDETETTSA